MIIKKELVVSGKKKAALVEELRTLKFRPFPKGKKKETGPEMEGAAALEEEEEGMASDYDYLLGMAIWSLTTEKVDRLLAERDAKEAELLELLKLSAKDIWNTDLDAVMAEWEVSAGVVRAAARSGGADNDEGWKRADGGRRCWRTTFRRPRWPSQRPRARSRLRSGKRSRRMGATMGAISRSSPKPPSRGQRRRQRRRRRWIGSRRR